MCETVWNNYKVITWQPHSPLQVSIRDIFNTLGQESKEDPLWSSEFRAVAPNTAAGQTVVLLSDRLGQLKLSQLTQEPSDAVFLKLRSSRISDQDFGAVGFDAAVQPAVKAGGEGLIIEHVPQEDQVKARGLWTNHAVSEANRRLQAVQLIVHAGCNGCNCNTNRHI